MMSALASDFFQRSPMLFYPLVALAVFATLFVVLSVRALLHDREELQRLAQLPLAAPERQVVRQQSPYTAPPSIHDPKHPVSEVPLWVSAPEAHDARSKAATTMPTQERFHG